MSPIEGLARLDAVCSGGGLTLLGWGSNVYIAGERFHLVNEPASSHWTIHDDGMVAGATRSVTTNLESAGGVTYWDFLSIPMVGQAMATFRCLGPLLTSTTLQLSGSPPEVPPSVLRVEAGGTTCGPAPC